jgi:acyl dehydratase
VTVQAPVDLEAISAGPLTRAWIARYAQASGDDNPIHLDPDYARALGLPSVIVHGTLLEGLLLQALARWYPAATLKRLATTFLSPIVEGQTVRITGRVLKSWEADAASQVLIRLKLERDDGKLGAAGEAHLVPAADR